MDDARRDTIGNILLLGSLALIFALLCRWFLIYTGEIAELEFWTENTYALEDNELMFSGSLGSDFYSLLLRLVFIITGNRLIGAIVLQLCMLVGSMVLLYFGVENFSEKLFAAIGVFLCLFTANVFPVYFGLGPDEFILLLCSLAFFLISLCTYVENLILVIGTACLIGLCIWFFPPVLLLLIPFMLGEKESERSYSISILSILGGVLGGFLLGMLLAVLISGLPLDMIFAPENWIPDYEYYSETCLFRPRTLVLVGIPALLLGIFGSTLLILEMTEKAKEEKLKSKEEAIDNVIAGIEAAEQEALAREAGEGEGAEAAADTLDGEAAPAASFDSFDDETAPADSFDSFDDETVPADSFDSFDDETAPAGSFDTLDGETAPADSFDTLNGQTAPADSFDNKDFSEDKDWDKTGSSDTIPDEDRVFTLADLPKTGDDDDKLDFSPLFNALPVEKPLSGPAPAKDDFDYDVPEDQMNYDFDLEVPEDQLHFDYD